MQHRGAKAAKQTPKTAKCFVWIATGGKAMCSAKINLSSLFPVAWLSSLCVVFVFFQKVCYIN